MRPARRLRGAAVLAAALLAAAPGAAQPFLPLGEEESAPVVTLDPERLFDESAFGRRVAAMIEAAAASLSAENRALETSLIAEERALTELRPTLPPEEFRALADAFDARVQELRRRQEGRSRALAEFRDNERQRFFAAALPELMRLLRESGAVAVLDQRAIVLALEDIDITDRLRQRLDAELGDGAGGAAQVLPDDPPPDLAPGRPEAPDPDPGAGGPPTELPSPLPEE